MKTYQIQCTTFWKTNCIFLALIVLLSKVLIGCAKPGLATTKCLSPICHDDVTMLKFLITQRRSRAPSLNFEASSCRGNERRQFVWSEFKQAKSDKRPARFDGGTLVVGESLTSNLTPSPFRLPAKLCWVLQVTSYPEVPARSITSSRHGPCQHAVRTMWGRVSINYCICQNCLGPHTCQQPRSCREFLLWWRYEIRTHDGQNFTRPVRKNVAVFVAHQSQEKSLPRRKKMDCLANVIGGAILAQKAMTST